MKMCDRQNSSQLGLKLSSHFTDATHLPFITGLSEDLKSTVLKNSPRHVIPLVVEPDDAQHRYGVGNPNCEENTERIEGWLNLRQCMRDVRLPSF